MLPTFVHFQHVRAFCSAYRGFYHLWCCFMVALSQVLDSWDTGVIQSMLDAQALGSMLGKCTGSHL
jgi:hypothetical protein